MAYSLGNPILYWLLRFFLLGTLIWSGVKISKHPSSSSQKYWLYALPSIVAYSLIQGLRWNRGVDYAHYYEDLQGLLYRDYSEILYTDWLVVFRSTGLPFWVAFVIYSFLLIISFFSLIKLFPKSADWALPIFFIVSVRYSENLIRQYIALPFIIYSVVNYFKHRYWLTLIYCGIAVMFHVASGITILFLFISHLLSCRRYCPPLYIPLIIYLFVFFFWDNTNLNFVADAVSQLQFGEETGMSGYIDNAERWWTEDGRLSVVHGEVYSGVSIYTLIVRFILYLFVIIAGHYAMQRNNELRIVYWFSFFAILLDVIKEDMEMYIRIYAGILFLLPILYGEIYSRLNLKPVITYVSWGCLFLYYAYLGIINNMFRIDPVGYAFVWDRS